MIVNIYIRCQWQGGFRGSGKAAAIIVCEDRTGKEHKKIVTTEVKDSTKERLQLQAVTKALYGLKKQCSVGIYIDNDLIKNAITNGWAEMWKENAWKNKRGMEIKNADVWKILVPLLRWHSVGIMNYLARYDEEISKVLEDV